MPNYSVEGKLGTGKTKFCVWMVQQAAREGRRVAGNVDIAVDMLTPERTTRYIRIPDKPTADDLAAIGHGNPDSYDESRNGVLILDELGTWLNARSFQDKGRAHVIDWLIHARKYGWDVYLMVQNSIMIDKQVRESLIEFQCTCRRMDKVKIPVVGWMLSTVYRPLGYLPKFHRVVARMGEGQTALVAETWNFRGTGLHRAYDTRQVFRSDYPHGPHSVLPPWDWEPRKGWWTRWRQLDRQRRVSHAKPACKPKHPLVAKIERLDPERAWQHVARLHRLGLLQGAGGPPSC